MTVGEAFELYINDFLLLKNRSAKTIESYDVTKKYIMWFTGNSSIEDLSLRVVIEWIKWLKSEPSTLTGELRSINTVRGYVMCLRVALKYLKERGYDVINPEPIPVPVREEKVPEFLRPKEINELIALSFQPVRGLSKLNRLRNRAIISLLFGSGLRVSEMCSMNRDCFFNDSFTVIGKGRVPRLCFLDERTKRYIDEYLEARKDTSSALFVANQTGARMTPSNTREMFNGLSVRFGRRVHPHIARHSFATDLLANNTNPRHVQALLGHKNLQTVQTYMHVVDEDLRRVYNEKHQLHKS